MLLQSWETIFLTWKTDGSNIYIYNFFPLQNSVFNIMHQKSEIKKNLHLKWFQLQAPQLVTLWILSDQ